MFKIIALVLIGIIFLFTLFINVRSYLARKRPIPEEIKDVYDEETYRKWKAYSADKILVKMIVSIVSTIVTIPLIVADVFALASKNIDNHYFSTLIVLAIYVGISLIIALVGDYFLRLCKKVINYYLPICRINSFIYWYL